MIFTVSKERRRRGSTPRRIGCSAIQSSTCTSEISSNDCWEDTSAGGAIRRAGIRGKRLGGDPMVDRHVRRTRIRHRLEVVQRDDRDSARHLLDPDQCFAEIVGRSDEGETDGLEAGHPGAPRIVDSESVVGLDRRFENSGCADVRKVEGGAPVGRHGEQLVPDRFAADRDVQRDVLVASAEIANGYPCVDLSVALQNALRCFDAGDRDVVVVLAERPPVDVCAPAGPDRGPRQIGKDVNVGWRRGLMSQTMRRRQNRFEVGRDVACLERGGNLDDSVRDRA